MTNQILSADPADAQNNKVMAVLAYLGILVIIPILSAKESPFARFHSNQGVWLLIVNLTISILSLIPFIGCLFSLLFVVSIIYIILGIMNAANGEMKYLPGFDKLPVLIK